MGTGQISQTACTTPPSNGSQPAGTTRRTLSSAAHVRSTRASAERLRASRTPVELSELSKQKRARLWQSLIERAEEGLAANAAGDAEQQQRAGWDVTQAWCKINATIKEGNGDGLRHDA